MEKEQEKKTTICVTGATGFVGGQLLKFFEDKNDFHIVALSRRLSPRLDGAKKNNIEWRRCDGFSLKDVENATKGCDILIYLIHSMVPSTSFIQGHFSDFDLYLADNFMRAIKKNKIQKVIYLTGIIPEDHNLSEHLKSRLEVEKTLDHYSNLYALRASIVIGKNGSSFQIIEKLIKRLPVLICPAWTKTKTQPIHIYDVAKTIDYLIKENPPFGSYDIGGADILTYKRMLQVCADEMRKKRYFFDVPFFSPKLSKFWVANVTMISKQLVYPLIDSLKHKMVADKNKKLTIPNHNYKNFSQAVKESFSIEDDGWFREVIDHSSYFNVKWLKNVTYIQRIKLNPKHSGEFLAHTYFEWLPRFMRPLFNVTVTQRKVDFCLFNKFVLLRLRYAENRSSKERYVYYITGGFLAKKRTLGGRLEFRNLPEQNCQLIILIDFRPSLPWFIYKYTQAKAHHFVMMRFQSYLEKNYR